MLRENGTGDECGENRFACNRRVQVSLYREHMEYKTGGVTI